MKKEFYYDSCGSGKICAHQWQPNTQPKAVVQIVHGIAEHAARYDDFAEYLNRHGILVVAEDHMGHGGSVAKGGIKGYFTGGWDAAVADTYRLLTDTMAAFPDVPYILFGHSMGSFMARTLIAKHPDSGIAGCIICGTGWQPDGVLKAGIAIADLICKVSNPQKASQLLHNIAFGAYNKRVEHPRTAYDWLTRDTKAIDAYVLDPMCGFTASACLMRDMFTGISYIQSREALDAMQKSLPVFFIAGGDDPVGGYGEGVRKSADAFCSAGMERVFTRIYPMCRHEILNEINKSDVYKDILDWITDLIK